MKLEREHMIPDYGVLGRIVHSTIEKSFYYMNSENLNMVIDPVSWIKEIVTKSLSEVKEKTDDLRLQRDVKKCLNNYIDFMVTRFNKLDKLDKLDLYLPEYNELSIENHICEIPFHGQLDVTFHDKRLRLIDWKTSTKTKIENADRRQATRYVIMYDHRKHMRATRFYVVNLRKPVSMKASEIMVTPEMVTEEEQHVKNLWEKACGSIFEKTPSNDNCFFCDYRIRCENSPAIINISNGAIAQGFKSNIA